ncbi:ABC transporter permease [Hydrogenophaga sp. A37]|uniref:ABC transporter permease n=1 Tax=Hydrogenophaga sp. A37 TaxID=1945864 RepID=UPI000986C215|nr:ABC transporter permease [Hydrogenophaga sp. A37]OOG88655.1 nitrate transport permease nrtB [Hydrogenophaga sp. A37]
MSQLPPLAPSLAGSAAALPSAPAPVAAAASAPAAAPTPPTPKRRRTGFWTVRAPISRRAYWVLAVTGLVTPLLMWAALAAWGGMDPTFMPSPLAVLSKTWDWALENNLLEDMGISVYRVVAGFVLSAVIALPLGLLIGSFRSVQALLEPLTDLIRYMPAVAFIPLVMLWVGIDEGSKISIIFIGTFFQMVLMVAEDVRRVPAAQVEAAQTMGASRWELVEKVILPSAKPALLDTLRITMGWAWTYLVVAELVAANSGLGYAILRAQRFLQTDTIFAGIIVIGLIGLVTDQLFRWLHRRAFPWLYLKG